MVKILAVYPDNIYTYNICYAHAVYIFKIYKQIIIFCQYESVIINYD